MSRIFGWLAGVSVVGLLGCRANVASGGAEMVISGRVYDVSGVPLSHMPVRTGSESTVTDSAGRYLLRVEGQNRVVVEVEATDSLGPTLAVVDRRAGVARYSRDIHVPYAELRSFDLGRGTSIEVSSMGRSIAVVVPPGLPSAGRMAFLRVTPYEPEFGPGDLISDGPADRDNLQSAGMVGIEVLDGRGEPIDLSPEASPVIEMAAGPPLPDIPDAEPMQMFNLDEAAGRWEQPSPAGEMNEPFSAPAPRFRYWNADRNFLAACVRGRASTPSGRECGGSTATGSGPDGISSRGTISSDGTFCVEGAQTWSSTVSIGGTSLTVTMPANPGSCESPATCADLGTIDVDEEDCPTGCAPGERDTPEGCVIAPMGGGGGEFCSEYAACSACSWRSCANSEPRGWYETNRGERFECRFPVRSMDDCRGAAMEVISACCR